jgi:hypothetical protein
VNSPRTTLTVANSSFDSFMLNNVDMKGGVFYVSQAQRYCNNFLMYFFC